MVTWSEGQIARGGHPHRQGVVREQEVEILRPGQGWRASIMRRPRASRAPEPSPECVDHLLGKGRTHDSVLKGHADMLARLEYMRDD